MAYHIIQKEASLISGFTPDKWMVNHPFYDYKKCCLKPENWQGEGEWASTEDSEVTYQSRRAKCVVCDADANAHEMRAFIQEVTP